jgi:hypothetical protein
LAESDFKVTVLGAINEVRRRSKLPPVTTVDQDSDSLTKLSYLNDVVTELSDHGNWQELYAEAIVSVQTSVREYAVSGVVVQNIHEVALSTKTAALRLADLDEIRRLQRVNSLGEPTAWCPKGVNGEGNPIITVDRWPTSNDTGYFNIGYYRKPNAYVTADGSTTIPFPARVVVQGLLTKTILDESDGEPTSRYASNLQLYQEMKNETYNRYNGDTGSTLYFRPGRRGR